jgi:alpha-L-fucosidase
MSLPLSFPILGIVAAMSILSSVASAQAGGMGAFGAYQPSKDWTPPSDPAVLKKLHKWQDEKLGILIHWGLYSQWGITESWSLVSTRYPWRTGPRGLPS